MLDKLFSLWREDVLFKRAVEETHLALDKAYNMFSFAFDHLFGDMDDYNKIYELDKEINVLEIEIRKKILEHMAIYPGYDTTPSLVLITIIIDIERLGDYSKNIVEVKSLYKFDKKDNQYYSTLYNMGKELLDLFKKTCNVLKETNIEEAKKLTDRFTEINHKCDDGILHLTEEKKLEPKDTVNYALLFRHFKRVSSHLRNIASSVINPFHRVGYKPEE